MRSNTEWCYCHPYNHDLVSFLCKCQMILLQSENQHQVYVYKTRMKTWALLLFFFNWELNLPLAICNPPKLLKIKTKAKVHNNIQVRGKVSLWWGPVLSLWAVSVTASGRLQVWLWDSDNTWVSIGFEPGFSTVLIVILVILLVLLR